jgi:hypothetical protein
LDQRRSAASTVPPGYAARRVLSLIMITLVRMAAKNSRLADNSRLGDGCGVTSSGPTNPTEGTTTVTHVPAATGELVSSAVGDARRKDQLARMAHHRHAARHTRTARLGLTWAAATVVALMLMLVGAAGGILYETQTAAQERGVMDRPY